MAVRRLAKAILPAGVVSALRQAMAGPAVPSWEAACAGAGSYDDGLVNRFRVERHELYASDGSALKNCVLNIVAQRFPDAGLTVTDFGGATGILGTDFLKAFPRSDYVVVENPTMVSLMQGRSPVKFSTEMPPACDIFFTSSALQYVDDPLAVLKQGFSSATRAVILVRNSFSETETFHVQTSRLFANGMGPIPHGYSDCEISYPHRTIRESDVMTLAEGAGFTCVARLEEISGAIGDSYGRQLVFLR
jgi:putative methyltransferase (TIGR04325 family)